MTPEEQNIRTASAWLLNAKRDREEAARQYRAAMAFAVLHGFNNVRIAKILKCSEAAVRMYCKRHNLRVGQPLPRREQ